MAVHSSAPTRLPRRLLSRRRRPHQRSGGLRRIFQPASTLDSVDVREPPRPSRVCTTNSQSQRQHLDDLHDLSGIDLCVVYLRTGVHLYAGFWIGGNRHRYRPRLGDFDCIDSNRCVHHCSSPLQAKHTGKSIQCRFYLLRFIQLDSLNDASNKTLASELNIL